MKALTMYDKATVEGFTLAAITTVNNDLAKVLGVKPTKRFGTKPAAVNALLKKQNLYRAANKTTSTKAPKAKSTPKTAKKSVKSTDTIVVSIVAGEPTEASTVAIMFEAIKKGHNTVDKLVAYTIKHYDRPNGYEIDRSLVLRRLNKAVANGYLKKA